MDLVCSLRKGVGLLAVMIWVTVLIGGSGVLFVWAAAAGMTLLWTVLRFIQLVSMFVAWWSRTSQ